MAEAWVLRKLAAFLSEGARPADNSLEKFLPLREYLSDLKLLSWQQIQLEFSGCTCLRCVIPPQGPKTLGSSFNRIKPSRVWTVLALSCWNRMNWKMRCGLKAIKLYWPHLPIIFLALNYTKLSFLVLLHRYDTDYSFILQKIIHKSYLQNLPRCTAGNSSIKSFTERVGFVGVFCPFAKKIYVFLCYLKSILFIKCIHTHIYNLHIYKSLY